VLQSSFCSVNEAYVEAEAYSVIDESFSDHLHLLEHLEPDQQMDVIEQFYSLFIERLFAADHCCYAGNMGMRLTEHLNRLEGIASPDRITAAYAVHLHVSGMSMMAIKHRNYTEAVKFFKQAVKFARKVQDTPFRIPGLIQLSWARAAECFFDSGKPDGFALCLRKALERLPDVVDRNGLYKIAMMSRLQESKDPEYTPVYQELLPGWLEAAANDASGQLLLRVGWYFCGSSYCSMKCVHDVLAIGVHCCEACYGNKWCPSGNWEHPLAMDGLLRNVRILATEDNAQTLFVYHTEQAHRLSHSEDLEKQRLRVVHAKRALRASDVKYPYHSNAARVSLTLRSLGEMAADNANQLLNFLQTRNENVMRGLGMMNELSRTWLADEFGEATVAVAERLYDSDKNIFADCSNDADIKSYVDELIASGRS